MTIIYHRGVAPYSSDHLNQLAGDLMALADDMVKAGCDVSRVTKLRKAILVVRNVRAENSQGDN